jgi:hypothetical protein
MANRKVSIWLHCKTVKGWRYCRPVHGKNNKIKPGYAWVNGAEQHFPDAQYCLCYQETSGRRVWDKVTKNAALAVVMAERRQAFMQAKAAGVPVEEDAHHVQPDSCANQHKGLLDDFRRALPRLPSRGQCWIPHRPALIPPARCGAGRDATPADVAIAIPAGLLSQTPMNQTESKP